MSSGQYTETAILNCLVVSNLLLFNHRNHHQPATVSPMNFSWIFSVLSDIHRHGHALQHYINNIYIYIHVKIMYTICVYSLRISHMYMLHNMHAYVKIITRVYVFMYIHVYVYMCIYVCIYMCVYVYIYIRIQVYMYICTYVLSYVYIHTSTYSISYYPWTNSVVFA